MGTGCRASVALHRSATQNAYLTLRSQLARSRVYEPGSYFELSVSPWGHERCNCPGFTYRGVCKHAESLRIRLRRSASMDGMIVCAT